MLELIVKGGAAYLLGSVVGSLVIGRFSGVDIRSLGSGNAGATNALRTRGWKLALPVFVIDLGKGVLATRVLAPAVIPGLTAEPELEAWCVPVCGLAVIVGHVYPLWFGLRGGKGFATFVGAVAGVAPLLLLVMLITWLIVVILSGYVGLASMLGAVALAVAIAAGSRSPHTPLVAFGILAALLIIFTHRSNIMRMRSGAESRAMRLWLLGSRRERR